MEEPTREENAHCTQEPPSPQILTPWLLIRERRKNNRMLQEKAHVRTMDQFPYHFSQEYETRLYI